MAVSVQNELCILKKDASSVAHLTAPGVSLNPLAVSPDGKWAVGASCEQVEELAFVWDLHTKQLVRRLPHSNSCYMVFSPDSRTLFTSSSEGRAAWNVDSWTLRWERPNLGPAKVYNFLAISGDGQTLAISRSIHGVDLFDPATGEILATIDHPDARAIGWLALDDAGSRLAINGSQHNIQLWDLRRLRRELQARHLDWSAPPLAPLKLGSAAPMQGVIVVPN